MIIVGTRADLPLYWVAPEATHSQERLLWEQWVTGEYWERHKVGAGCRPTMVKSANVVGKIRAHGCKPQLAPWRTVRDAIGDLPEPTTGRIHIANHRFQPGARAYVGHTGSPLDEPAKALKAGDHGVPGGENMIARADGSVRYFSVREAARLQCFPDEFEFPATVAWGEIMRQLGNAVPSRLAEVFGHALACTLQSGRRAA